jgi:hypothetical protein
VKWTHWNDLADIYGVDKQGHAPITIDNVGVQYGLGALAQGAIGADEFLRINACVGSWKDQADFVPWDEAGHPYDDDNMRRSATCRDPAGVPAPRRAGDVAAIAQAHRSGQVFSGRRLGVPMIDLRPYLEQSLNMHNARQAFSVRARLLAAHPGEAARQVIWFAHPRSDLAAAVMDAVAVMDRYLSGAAAPAEFADRCTDAQGAVIAAGPGVWDGVLDRKAAGACTSAYPIFASPRMVAGDSLRGDIFQCALKSVATALDDGTYPASVRFSSAQQAWLRRIFPQGVCDFGKGDVGRSSGKTTFPLE